ncbi:MAG: hypothetical protein COV10_01885 [Candidatus Vogelbacteria bacterium CG10_big_fil_rev_8_21_14_0_10_51_16]|uniref:Uncharacterized protein n=1 Tax=Candidatus Vogelbacteria bacterium CG10_big_fil_rev_8_21_14_0_10_51_16 TaxID=1975045 RepID=A0A2H0REV1_9BACT|nr:MAG: hypothetical protein COV10_01885 [Candidatus Vogelbacteria bacterium CG10_big_fil_rev_8_21_14_0_10_51_16]
MIKTLSSVLRFSLVATLLVFGASVALAQTAITYPIAELGACADRAACKAYCASPKLACVDFAEKQGMIGVEEAMAMRQAIERAQAEASARPAALSRDDLVGSVRDRSSTGNAPGPQIRQRTPTPPKTVQNRSDDNEPNINKEKAQAAIEKFGGPGGCTDMVSCGQFCDSPENTKACVAYAREHDLMGNGDLERFERMADIVGPGGCRGRQCQQYCDAPGHEDECLAFAKENNLIPEEEVREIERMMNLVGPGGCRGRACETYCEDPAHTEACMQFAVEQGMMSKEEFNRAMTPGPGGCKGPACEQFCRKPENQEACATFYGFERGGESEGRLPMDRFDDARFGSEAMKSLRTGSSEPPGPMEEFVGPGDCRGRACETYCRDNEEACRSFSEEQHRRDDGMSPQMEDGPIMMKERQTLESQAREMMEGMRPPHPDERKEIKLDDLGRRYAPGSNKMPPGNPEGRPFMGEGFSPPPFEGGQFPGQPPFRNDEMPYQNAPPFSGRDGMPHQGDNGPRMEPGPHMGQPPFEEHRMPSPEMKGEVDFRLMPLPAGETPNDLPPQHPAPTEAPDEPKPEASLRDFLGNVVSAFMRVLPR